MSLWREKYMRKIIMLVALGVGFAGLSLFLGCGPQREKDITPIDKTALQRPPEYVGSNRCGECHDRIFWTWKGTKHPYKITEPNEKTVVGDFAVKNTLELVDKREGVKKEVAK